MNSHFKIKAVAAALALALSGAAAAETLDGEEMFFTAWNGNSSAASSIVINLGMTTSEFRDAADEGFVLSGASLTTLTNWITSLGAGANDIQWGVSGVSLGSSPGPSYGLLTTSTDITSRDPAGWGLFTGLDGAVGNYPIFFTQVNPGLGSTDAFFAANASQLFSPSFNGGVSITALAGLGEAVGFYAMFADQGGNEFFEGDFASLGGTWRLAFSGGVASLAYAPVPLPAAFWLLSSGLIGLFGIGRRKAAA